MTKLQENYSGYLKDENCEVDFNNEEEGDFIRFTYEGVNYLLSVNKDPVTDIVENVRIVTGYPYDFESEEKIIKSLKIVNSINGEMTRGKIYIDLYENIFFLETSFYIIKTEYFGSFLKVCTEYLETMLSNLLDQIEKKQNHN